MEVAVGTLVRHLQLEWSVDLIEKCWKRISHFPLSSRWYALIHASFLTHPSLKKLKNLIRKIIVAYGLPAPVTS